jgi:hypothetical protein
MFYLNIGQEMAHKKYAALCAQPYECGHPIPTRNPNHVEIKKRVTMRGAQHLSRQMRRKAWSLFYAIPGTDPRSLFYAIPGTDPKHC